MADMLVKLYALPDLAPALAGMRAEGIEVRRAHPDEKHTVAEWVRAQIHPGWGKGCETALEQRPPTLFLATEKDPAFAPTDDPYHLPPELLLGFACYDVVARGMFGPIGVREDRRDRGIGTALLLASLHAMAHERYAYAVIGWAGPTEWYERTVGAVSIEGSEPGVFRGPLR